MRDGTSIFSGPHGNRDGELVNRGFLFAPAPARTDEGCSGEVAKAASIAGDDRGSKTSRSVFGL